ncbi:MAG: hypothetical protein ICV60_04420 [Pyrinomonadaceae bacterium]|nr:hypothetical protein [Pyrinomonadaceae bacterium]
MVAPGYTESIGNDLGITGADSDGPSLPENDKPEAKAIALPNSQVRIEFVKRNFDGVLIESRRTGEMEWAQLGTDNYSPYLDSRPPRTQGQPEVREYRLRYLSRDEAVGQWSDIISVTTTP